MLAFILIPWVAVGAMVGVGSTTGGIATVQAEITTEAQSAQRRNFTLKVLANLGALAALVGSLFLLAGRLRSAGGQAASPTGSSC